VQGWKDDPLERQLATIDCLPSILVQSKFRLSLETQQNLLTELGVDAVDLELIPRFEAFIPDLLVVGPASSAEYELTLAGERRYVDPADTRCSIQIIDVKHAHEANPSYESEVVLYAIALAHWLSARGQHQYFVSSNVALWTRGGIGRGRFQEAIDAGVVDPEALLAAVHHELEPANVAILAQAVRRFFVERLPTVVRAGAEDWRSLDWHVGPRCSSCDWLGFEGWLGPKDRVKVDAAPDHYCFHRANTQDHLSRLPLITRGSRRVLEQAGLGTVTAVAATNGAEMVYGQHNRLKSDRRSIPGFATALTTLESSIDPDRADGMLARYADLDIFLSVNFDSGAGLLTGIGLHAYFTQHHPYGQIPDPSVKRRWREKWIVSAKSSDSEADAILAFLQYLAVICEFVTNSAPDRGGAHASDTSAQVIFWDRRQFQELCRGLGRHLLSILYSGQERIVRALAWLFPPEELQELDNIDDRRPSVAFVRDSVRRLIRVPARHALTLFNVAERYHVGDSPFRPPDQFYREPLSDMIPRERSYELWSLSAAGGHGVIRWGSVIKTLGQLMESFGRAIDAQGFALSTVTWRLRQDFGARLKAGAPKLRLSVPTWSTGVPQDSKLWIAWASFETSVSKSIRHLAFTTDAEELEASHESLRLMTVVEQHSDGAVTYIVSEDSLNTKVAAPDDYMCLAVDSVAGFLALPLGTIVDFDQIPGHLKWLAATPMHKLFRANLLELDRTNRRAKVILGEFWGSRGAQMEEARTLVIDSLGIAFDGPLSLVRSTGTDVKVKRLSAILRAVGRPAMATPAPQSTKALGLANQQAATGNDPATPVARVLWRAASLSQLRRRSDGDVGAVVAVAQTAGGLNASQVAAVAEAAAKALTIIWGPPGTGKTKTCAALLHGVVVQEASVNSEGPYSILITGPTYKAVGGMVEQLLSSLTLDTSAVGRLYCLYSSSRLDRFPVPESLPTHIKHCDALSDWKDEGFQQLVDDLEGQTPGVVIVAAVTHQCARLAEQPGRLRGASAQVLWPLFDFVLIDETSQVDITTAVGPLSLLKESFQIVVAGDHLQMGPVVAAEPPVGAEYLVGSLQGYLGSRFGIRAMPLLLNYRSNADIVEYVRTLGYPAQLQAAYPGTALDVIAEPSALRDELEGAGLLWSESWPTILDPTKPLVALTYPDGIAGQANPFEAQCVASIVWLIYAGIGPSLSGRPSSDNPSPVEWTDESFWRTGIGIVTPHRAQRAQVVRALRQAFPQVAHGLIEGSVDTVERFQGGERHTIVISFGVGDPDVIAGEEAFLLELERTNVAISRAMAKCVVLMSDEIAHHIPDDRKVAASAHALRGIIDEWCNRRYSTTVGMGTAARPVTVRWRE